MAPYIVNFDSAFDWTSELHSLLEQLDWERIRKAVAPNVPPSDWIERRDSLGTIGLVSILSLKRSYSAFSQSEMDCNEDDHNAKEWRDRQLNTGSECCETTDNPRRPLNGEEPHFRSSHVGHAGVIECYGIYVDDISSIIHPRGFSHLVPAELLHSPAVLLCPARLYKIYPTLMKLRQKFRNELRLSAHPALVNLRLTLLHELGHHFFPVHQSGSVRYISEGLANYFCYQSASDFERAWLLYKTWHLQPPEYSVYRPLNILCEVDGDCHAAVGRCFHGTLDGWAALPTKVSGSLEDTLPAAICMALACDASACEGVWRRELRQRMSGENRHFLHWDGGNIMCHHFGRHGYVPADLIDDLYRQRDLTRWLAAPGLSEHFWGSWGHGDVCWPEDAFHALPRNAELLIARHCAEEHDYSAGALRRKLASLNADFRVCKYISEVVVSSVRMSKPMSSTVINDLDWILNVMVPSDVSLGEEWAVTIAEYVEKQYESGFFNFKMTLGVLKRIPGFQPRPMLQRALDKAIACIRIANLKLNQNHYLDFKPAISLILACNDESAVPVMEEAKDLSNISDFRNALITAIAALRQER